MAAPQGTTSGKDQRQPVLQFASKTAHEIVGPVDQISSLVALFVERYRGKLDVEADTLLSYIEAARLRLGNTTAGLRKCFQVITAQCEHAPVDMNAALDAALGSLGREIEECSAEVHADPLPVVQGDRDLLIHLFQALVGNALKFRQPEVRPRVSVSVYEPPRELVFEVKDNGIGIDARYREVVFEPYKKLNGHAYPGAGLGLTMARLIVEMHGGSIRIEPAPQGTTVRFALPANTVTDIS